MSDIITLYDIDSSRPTKAFSPHTWKGRLCLNYKGIPYRTVWVEYPDIAGLCKKIGAAPTEVIHGVPHYTLPVIHDPSTDTVLSDSVLIAEYLDATYPDTPTLLPSGTHALQHAFLEAFNARLTSIWPFIVPVPMTFLNPISQEYYRRTRELWFGKKLEDIVPTGEEHAVEWVKVKAGLDGIDKWFQKSAKLDGGPFLLGQNIGFVDIVVASFMSTLKSAFGQDSAEWKEINDRSEGRWEALLERFEKYMVVV